MALKSLNQLPSWHRKPGHLCHWDNFIQSRRLFWHCLTNSDWPWQHTHTCTHQDHSGGCVSMMCHISGLSVCQFCVNVLTEGVFICCVSLITHTHTVVREVKQCPHHWAACCPDSWPVSRCKVVKQKASVLCTDLLWKAVITVSVMMQRWNSNNALFTDEQAKA